MLTRPNAGEHSDSGHLVQHPSTSSGSRAQARQPVQSWILCWEFSLQHVCSKKSCKFRHGRPLCNGAHAVPGLNLSLVQRGEVALEQVRIRGKDSSLLNLRALEWVLKSYSKLADVQF